MPWASTTEYNDAIQNLRTSVSDEELQAGELARTSLGLPLLWSGNFADVYRVHCEQTGNTWAVKCFTRESPGLKERYRKISAHLNQARLPFMVDFQFVEPGIRVGSAWYPFLKMRWVEGLNLNQFVGEHVTRPSTLKQLLGLWVKLSARLRQARIAHADLQHGNVLLVPLPRGKLALRLIDYDGMYVPALAGRPPGEVGHPAYQHPQRLREGVYNSEVDRFSQLAVYSAVRCLTVGKRPLWTRFDNGDNLLFREVDFQSPGKSEVFHQLWALGDPDARALIGRLILATQMPLDRVSLLSEVVSNGGVRRLSRDEERQVRALLDRGASAIPRRPISFTPWRTEGRARPFASGERGPAFAAPQAGTPGRTPPSGGIQDTSGFWKPPPVGTPAGSPSAGSPGSAAGKTRWWVSGQPEPAKPQHPPPRTWYPQPPRRRAAHLDREVAIHLGGGLTMELVLIAAGQFLMGAPAWEQDAQSREKPQHRVRLTQPFYLAKYPVTQEQWQAVMGYNPSRFKALNGPVEQVSWDDCQAFLSKLNGRHGTTGATFRLPTEAEWEYACRAGSSTRWCFGDDEATLGNYAWYYANSGRSTHPVGQKRPNAWGLYDVHGNVWEWCADWYDGDYYRTSASRDPKGPHSGDYRVLRGGSWAYDPWGTRSTFRHWDTPGGRDDNCGFRVAGTA
jgi:formylglycine-generating enzyme required for sulfatase activity